MAPEPLPEAPLDLTAVPARERVRPGLTTLRAALTAPWLLTGLGGLLLVLALPLFSSIWTLNMAGTTINRGLVSQSMDPSARAGFERALAGLEERAAGGDSIWSDGLKDKAFWRTYGAAASQAPSEGAFLRLLDARSRDLLDRVAFLWLAEVAAATGHWGEANEAYLRLDSANLLINRAQEALDDGRRQEARSWLTLAAASVRSVGGRTETSGGVAGLDATLPHESDLLRAPGGRAISLLRLGQGFLRLSYPEEAVPLLEEALAEMQLDPPGVLERQSIQLHLARALAGVRPPDRPVTRATQARIVRLVDDSLSLDRSAHSLLQAAAILRSVREGPAAYRLLQEAVERFPHVAETHLALGALLHERGRVFLAREVYEGAVATLPRDARLAGEYGKMTFLTDTHEEAAARLERATELGSTDVWVFAYLGDAYRMLNRPDEARRAYLDAMEHTKRVRWLEARLQLVARMERLDP